MNPLRKLALWTAKKAAYYSGVTVSLSDTGVNQKLGTFFGGSTVTGKNVNETTAMQVTAFFACIRLLAETMGAMPSAIYRKEDNGNSVRAEEHPLHDVLVNAPNADMNGIEFRESSTANLAARGNAFSIIERRADGNVSALYPVPCAQMTIKREAGGLSYGVPDRGKTEWYPPEKIWHRRGFSFDGLIGLSPLQCAREAIGLALAGEEFNARLFGQGLMPSARISIPQWLTDEQREKANKKLLEMHTGLSNMNKPMLLEGGMKVESGLITPEDAQFLQLRQLGVIEICRILGVKPHMIAALERATDNNIEKLSLEFVTYTMLPYLRRDEQAARKLLKPGDRSKYFYRYNFEGLLRADSAARAALYSIMLQNGVFSRNEVRALENRNKVEAEGMDEFTVQTNMAMIEQLAAIVAAREAPKEPIEAPSKSLLDSMSINVRSFGNEKDLQQLDILAVKVAEMSAKADRVSKNVADISTDTKRKMMDIALATEKSIENRAAATEKRLTAIADGLAEKMAAGLADVKAQARKPRKAIFDDKGNPIGVEIVDTLH